MVLGRARAASTFAERTHAIVIGVGPYDDKRLPSLSSPPNDVTALATALTAPDGCALSRDHVGVLGNHGERVTAAALQTTLTNAVDSASGADTLFLYFGGHGLTDGSDFYLCTSETDIDNLRETAISGAVIATILRRAPVRGVVVILDCCRGAGFAERAPAFFRELGDSDFRILLSAARATEPSIELANGVGTVFTQQLIRAVSGNELVGRTPGLIYYSELLSYLDTRIAEEWDRLGLSLPKPQPVATAVTARDPLLLVHRGMTLAHVWVREARYSRLQILRAVRRAAITTLVVGVFVAGTLYAYLDHSEFVRLDADGVAVYDGLPTVHVFGFPRRRWVVDMEPYLLRADATLRRRGVPLVAPLGESVAPLLLRDLQPVGVALFRYRRGDTSGAREELRRFVESSSFSANETASGAVDLFGEIADRRDIPLLQRLAQRPNPPEIRQAAALALVTWDRPAGLRHVAEDVPLDAWRRRDVYRHLHGACDPSASAFLSDALRNSADRPAVLDALVRLRCGVPVTALVEGAVRSQGTDDRRDTVTYALWTQRDAFRRFLIGIVEQGRTVAMTDEEAARYATIIETAAMLGESPRLCGIVRTMTSPHFSVRRALVEATARSCPADVVAALDRSLPPLFSTGPSYVATLVERHIIGAHAGYERVRIRGAGDTLLVANVLGRRREATDAVVARLLLASNDEGLQTAGLRILARNAVSAPIPAEFFTGSSATLAEAAYRWKLSIDHARAVTELRNRIADERARYVSAVLADAQLMDRDLAFFRRLCSAGVTERQRALEVLAVYAPTDEVLDLLTSPDAFERNVVQPWIAGRADLGRLIDGASKRVAANPTAPGSVSLLRAFAQTRTELQQEVDALPTSLQPWIASVMLQANENAPSGIRHWIEQKANP